MFYNAANGVAESLSTGFATIKTWLLYVHVDIVSAKTFYKRL